VNVVNLAPPFERRGIVSATIPPVTGAAAGGEAGSVATATTTAWLPWAAAGVVAAIVGGVAGAAVFGSGGGQSPAQSSGFVGGVAGLNCPSGVPVTDFIPNERVLVTARSEDGAFLAVRDNGSLGRTVWVPASVVTVDGTESPINSLPVGGCPDPVVVIAAEAAPELVPDAPPPPTGGGDAAPDELLPAVDIGPNVTAVSVSPNPFCNDPVSVAASIVDDKGVAGATLNWSGASTTAGSAPMSGGGSQWSVSLPMFPCTSDGQVTFRVVARDTVGQTAERSTSVLVKWFG